MPRVLFAVVMIALIPACGGDKQGENGGGGPWLVVVSPHQDDETIMAGGTLFRIAREGRTRIELIYVTAGDAAGRPGPCNEESEEEKKRKIIELREEETRRACGILGIGPSRLHFLRYPDQALVENSVFIDGKRADVLTEAGEQAVTHVVKLLPTLIPGNATELTVITASFWDAHPDHRVTYLAARAAAEIVRNERGIPVRLLHAIVHDEIPCNISFCCLGDLHWPNPGPNLDHSALFDFPSRPRPPLWDVINDVEEFVSVRVDALNAHESQIKGAPELCMIVMYKKYYYDWMDKAVEVFYEEILYY